MTTAQVAEAKRKPARTATTKPSLWTLPDDIIVNIISFLPSLPPETTSRHLKQAYENLSLARLQPRYAYFSSSQVANVTSIDPFPEISHVAPVAHLPPYARPKFLSFLVGLCRNLDTLRAPCLKGVLQYAGDKLQDISLIDTGLSDADLLFLSRSSLKYASIKNPSPPVLTALAQVRTLEYVSLRRISEDALPHVLNFLECTTADSFYTSVNSTFPEPLLALLRGLPFSTLKSFVLKCDVHQLWALRYLRRIAMQVDVVEMIVGGVAIEVLPLDECDVDSDLWDSETLNRLICKKDLGANGLSTSWRDCMSIREIDLEVFQHATKRGVKDDSIFELMDDYFRDDGRDFERIHLRFGRTIPSVSCAHERISYISGTDAHHHVTNLEISQDVVLYAWRHCSESSNLLTRILNRFSRITTLHLITPNEGRMASARFVMGLPDFLGRALSHCPTLRCVYLEDAGELVLQDIGMPILTDETRVKEMIKAVVVAIGKLEADNLVEMGTVIAQLELWASSDLRAVECKDLNDVALLSLGSEPPGSKLGKDWSNREECARYCEEYTLGWNSPILTENSGSEQGYSNTASERESSSEDVPSHGRSGDDELTDDSSDHESSD